MITHRSTPINQAVFQMGKRRVIFFMARWEAHGWIPESGEEKLRNKTLLVGLEPWMVWYMDCILTTINHHSPWNFEWLSIQLGMEVHHPNWRTPSFFRGEVKNHQPETDSRQNNIEEIWLAVSNLFAFCPGWWFGTIFFPYMGNSNPNWRTHIFQRGRYTTNHIGDFQLPRMTTGG